MGTVCYNVIYGEVFSETRDGVRKVYIPDALGNTVAMMDSTGAFTDTFDYFPSGTVASRTGTTPTPFQWVGNKGYYRDNSKRVHVRARNFHVNLGRWAETDPIGFAGGDYNLYRYVKNRFVVMIDPTGLQCSPYKNKITMAPDADRACGFRWPNVAHGIFPYDISTEYYCEENDNDPLFPPSSLGLYVYL